MIIWVATRIGDATSQRVAGGSEKELREKLEGQPDGSRWQLARVDVDTGKDGIVKLAEGELVVKAKLDGYTATANGGKLRRDR